MDNLEICSMSVIEMAEAVKTERLSAVEIADVIKKWRAPHKVLSTDWSSLSRTQLTCDIHYRSRHLFYETGL